MRPIGQTVNFFGSLKFLLQYLSNRFGKFLVVPEKFHFLEKVYLEKLRDLAEFGLLLRHIWMISERRSLLKNGISLELLGIFQNSLKCIEVEI